MNSFNCCLDWDGLRSLWRHLRVITRLQPKADSVRQMHREACVCLTALWSRKGRNLTITVLKQCARSCWTHQAHISHSYQWQRNGNWLNKLSSNKAGINLEKMENISRVCVWKHNKHLLNVWPWQWHWPFTMFCCWTSSGFCDSICAVTL